MKHNTALTISGILTAFVLVVIGGVVVSVYGFGQNDLALPLASETVQNNQQTSPPVDQLVGDNQVLPSAQQQNPGSVSLQLSVDPAAALVTAQSVAGNGAVLKGIPQLVNLEGKMAYEVSFDQGTIYVDATSGQVLFNGTQPQLPAQPQAGQQVDVQLAGQIAANYLGENDIVSVELVNYNSNTMAYRVSFQSGNVVFVDMTGQVIYYQLYSLPYSGSSGGGIPTSSGEDGHDGEGGGFEDDDD